MSSDLILILATQGGILSIPIPSDGPLGKFSREHQETAFEAVCQDASGTFYAGSDQGRIYQSEDGQKWSQVFAGFSKSKGLWSMAAHPVRPQEIYAGLEPASVWISWDGGKQWEELSALREHTSSKQWRFYDHKPHVRAMAFNRDGTRFHVGIEEGGNLISGDGGKSFEDRTAGADPDVHTIQVTHADPNLVFLTTGDGLYRSRNAGARWERMENGLDRSYVVPMAILHGDAKVVCVGAAGNGPGKWASDGADSAIYRSEDWGGSFRMADGPFPIRGMIASIVVDPENRMHLFAGTNNGQVLRSTDGGKSWAVAIENLPRIEEMVIRWR